MVRGKLVTVAEHRCCGFAGLFNKPKEDFHHGKAVAVEP